MGSHSECDNILLSGVVHKLLESCGELLEGGIPAGYGPLTWTPVHSSYIPYTKQELIEQTPPESNRGHTKGP